MHKALRNKNLVSIAFNPLQQLNPGAKQTLLLKPPCCSENTEEKEEKKERSKGSKEILGKDEGDLTV